MPVADPPTAADLLAMQAEYAAGASFREVAARRGRSKNWARWHLLAAGVEPDRARSISAQLRGRPGHRKGARHSPETRAKLSAALKGKPGTRFGPFSDETRRRMSQALKGRKPSGAAVMRRPPKYSPEEARERERVRQACKRFVRRVLKAKGVRKDAATQHLVGYTTAELVAHLGPRPARDAEVDHIVPIAEFFRRGIFDPAVINALPNLRWLPAAANRRKTDKVPAGADNLVAICIAFASASRAA